MDTFLLCPPDYFKIDYSINPWMTGELIDIKIAKTQWLNLVKAIQESGGVVKTIAPIQGLPDMVFTANAGIVKEDTFIVSSMKHDQRKPESMHFQNWFQKNSYDIVCTIPGVSFEGCGDSLIHFNTLIGGYGYRSDLLALEITAGALGLDLVYLKLAYPRYYHLDTCFCKVSDTHAIYYPGAFKPGEVEKLKNIIELIPISECDARLFMCNSMLVNETLLIPSRESNIEKTLQSNLGIKTRVVNVSEFLKSGGSIQCLSLRL
jgi:N-dimethylarginine dimethylaminohydrolase